MKTWETRTGLKIIQLISGRSNVFVLFNGRDLLLVDTSVSLAWSLLSSRIDALLSASGGRLRALVLTHAHFDHVENAARIKARYNPAVFIHASEAAELSLGRSSFPSGTNAFSRWLVKHLFARATKLVKFPPLDASHRIEDRLDLSPFGFDAVILPTPGHTCGSVSVIASHEIALVGDALFGVFPGSAMPPFGDDVPALISSWSALLNTGCRIFLPAHGGARSRDALDQEQRRCAAIIPS